MTYAIALVDSNQDVVLSLSALLKDEGYCVETYADGDLALGDLRRRPVNLVISDIVLPRMGGLEFLRNLRSKDNVTVIFLTDVADEVDEVMALHMGADDYIKKPFSRRLLLERIRAILRRRN